MAFAIQEYNKIFNAIEFENKINRLVSINKNSCHTNLLKRPIHTEYKQK